MVLEKKKKKKDTKTPSYYVRKRLTKNIPAMFGLVLIVVAHIIAFLGYLIMPDQTPNANDGSPLIKKQQPGFEAKLLKVRKNRNVERANIIARMYLGQESEYTIMPVGECYVKGLEVYYTDYGRPDKIDSLNLITTVVPLYVGTSSKINSDVNYKVKGDKITYLDPDEVLHTTTISELQKKFETENIETRKYTLGTDKAGSDILSRLLFGTRISLSIGFISVLISVIVGVTLGSLAGFFG